MSKDDREHLRKVIFLDIDGVLQPGSNQERFENDLDLLRKKLAEKYNNEEYLEMDKYDLGAVYYDWDNGAVERLKALCADTPAELVISSAWRNYSSIQRLKDYFRLHDLGKYITGAIPKLDAKGRHEEIAAYLEESSPIHRFVILDDAYISDFEAHYPEQFVYCRYVFTEECYEKAKSILSVSS